MAEIFEHNIIVVYFAYGLAFFLMGIVVWLESARTSEFRIARAIGPLAGFGIIHGLHEWFEMFQQLSRAGAANIPEWLLLEEIRIPHLVVSFLLLVIFGVRLIYASHRKDGKERRFALSAAGALLFLWLGSVLVTRSAYDLEQPEFIRVVDVLARYMLGIPGALLAAWAIILERRSFRARGLPGFGRDLQWAAWALILYGVVGQAFPGKSILFPSTVVNAEWFMDTFGFPVQFFRATEAAVMALFVIRGLRAFDHERQQRLSQANEARLQAQREALDTQRRAQQDTEMLYQELQERESLLAELLHRVVSAQETERQRIARELHDGTGQILTGLGLGLAAASATLSSDPERAANQLTELKELNSEALSELRNVISDLRPSLLDDMGLVAACRAQVSQFESRTGVRSTLEVAGHRRRVRPDIETVVFRIAQEALTNVAKHASAQSATVRLIFDKECLELIVEDDGRGFDPVSAMRPDQERRPWGLLGMKERASLVGGTCSFNSAEGQGTVIQALVPLMNGMTEHGES